MLIIPRSTKNTLVIQPSGKSLSVTNSYSNERLSLIFYWHVVVGKIFFSGIAEGYEEEDSFDESMLGAYISKTDFKYVISTLNLELS